MAAAAAGQLAPQEFAYVRVGFFPDVAQRYHKLLQDLGPLQRADLLERRELGDDVVLRWRAFYAAKTLSVRLALAPDGKVSTLSIRDED